MQNKHIFFFFGNPNFSGGGSTRLGQNPKKTRFFFSASGTVKNFNIYQTKAKVNTTLVPGTTPIRECNNMNKSHSDLFKNWKWEGFLVTIMTPLLWTLQAIHICLSTSRSTHHHEGRRNWSCLSKLFNGNWHLSQVFRNGPNIKLVGWRTLTTWRRRSGYKRTIHQHPEATWRTLGDEVHSSRFFSQTIPSQTFKPG